MRWAASVDVWGSLFGWFVYCVHSLTRLETKLTTEPALQVKWHFFFFFFFSFACCCCWFCLKCSSSSLWEAAVLSTPLTARGHKTARRKMNRCHLIAAEKHKTKPGFKVWKARGFANGAVRHATNRGLVFNNNIYTRDERGRGRGRKRPSTLSTHRECTMRQQRYVQAWNI